MSRREYFNVLLNVNLKFRVSWGWGWDLFQKCKINWKKQNESKRNLSVSWDFEEIADWIEMVPWVVPDERMVGIVDRQNPCQLNFHLPMLLSKSKQKQIYFFLLKNKIFLLLFPLQKSANKKSKSKQAELSYNEPWRRLKNEQMQTDFNFSRLKRRKKRERWVSLLCFSSFADEFSGRLNGLWTCFQRKFLQKKKRERYYWLKWTGNQKKKKS